MAGSGAVEALVLSGLSRREMEYVRRKLNREPNEVEWSIIDAEWSEHSSYKSSKALLKLLPTEGARVLLGPGYDAGIVDAGDGYVLSLHIESHNHPSAVDPYGGAATGIGGVLRDILSIGNRPIALVDVLRFGRADRSLHSAWLFKNVVHGIADYGNCVGVPTVAGEIEFDESFERNCLVDVGCVGLGRRDGLVLAEATVPGDLLILAGGSTGRDGIRGASFASKNLEKDAESDRSSVQVPDPFTKKLLIDSILEALDGRLVRGMKDLGGGGLSTALSEVASKGRTGVEVELGKVNLREADMTSTEIMISESQERMLLISDAERAERIMSTFYKYGVPASVIGTVTADGLLTIRRNGRTVAQLGAEFVAEAPLIPRAARRPAYLHGLALRSPRKSVGASDALLALLSSPNIASRRWVYQQYDHEVGVRTVLKPGSGDAAVLSLPNGRLMAVKADGNSKQTYIDPYNGAAGCAAEACRNVLSVGAEPVALVDHLQFGDPGDPEVYWCFSQSVHGIADYCRAVGLPVVGGKVSFYNEDAATKKAIKPSPVAMVVGLVDSAVQLVDAGLKSTGDSIIIVGGTRKELGGSEYYEHVLDFLGGAAPRVVMKDERGLSSAMLDLTRNRLANAVHDCSKGGLGVALAEMCLLSGLGAEVDLGAAPAEKGLTLEELLYSESHGRFIVTCEGKNTSKILNVLKERGVASGVLGEVVGGTKVVFKHGKHSFGHEVDRLRRLSEGAIPKIVGDRP